MGKGFLQFTVILVIYLIIGMPISFALSITNDTVTPHQTSADFSWQTDNSSTSKVDYGLTPAYGLSTPFSNDQVKNHASTATGLTPNTLYYYKLTSTDGNFPAEKPGTFKTADATPPSAPTKLNATIITKTSITFSWDVSAEQEFLKFTLYRNSDKVYDGMQAAFTDTNLTPGTSYTYQLSVWDTSGNEGPKLSYSVTTKSIDSSPPVITNITIIDSQDTSAKIAWKTDDNSTSLVYYRTAAGNIVSNVSGLTKNHTVSITVKKGEKIYYKVSSCNEDGYCKNSTETGFVGGKDVTKPTIMITPLDNSTNGVSWYNKDSLDMSGKTEGFAFVQAWVDGNFQGDTTANENGTFNFTNVALNTGAQINNVLVKSTDVSLNTFSKTYKVMLDFNKPILTVIIPSILGNSSLKVKGNVSELSRIEVYLTSIPKAPETLTATSNTDGVHLTWSDTGANYYYIYKDGNLIASTDSLIKTYLDKETVNRRTSSYKVSSLNFACDESDKKEVIVTATVDTIINLTVNRTSNQTASNVKKCIEKPKDIITQAEGNFTTLLNFPLDTTYIVKIVATDKAGNIAEVKQSVLVNYAKPIISSVHPIGEGKSGDFYYVDALDSVTITGKTSNFTTVKLWIHNDTGGEEPDETTTSDANGNFVFKDVDFTTFSVGKFLTYSDFSQTNIPRNVSTSRLPYEATQLKTWLDTKRFYVLQATNQAGLSSDINSGFYNFGIATCFNGNFSWSVVFKPEYQSPQFLSVERLEEGTERLAFYFELNWVGAMATSDSVQIVGKPIITKMDLDASKVSDKAYNLTKIMANNIDFSNSICDPTNRKCYFVAKISPIKTTTGNWSFDDWKELSKALSNQLRLPIQISVTYRTINPNTNTYTTNVATTTTVATNGYPNNGINYNSEQTQIMCKELSFPLDNTKLDFSKLPDWLTDGGIKFLNSSIKSLDTILAKSKPIIDAVGYVWVGSFITYMAVRVARTVSEKMQIYNDKLLGGKISITPNCYTDGNDKDALKTIKGYYTAKGQSVPLNYINRLSNKNLEACYPTLNSLWKAEENIYKVYKYTGNRIFCKAAPAKWTGEQYTPALKVTDSLGNVKTIDKQPINDYNSIIFYLQSQDISEKQTCNGGETVRGMELIKTTCNFKNKESVIPNVNQNINYNTYNGRDECYLLDDAYWTKVDYMPSDPTKTLTNGIFLKKVYTPVDALGGTTYKQKDYVVAMPLNPGNYDRLFTGIPGSCKDNCAKSGFKNMTTSSATVFTGPLPISECRQKIIEGSGLLLGATYGSDEEFQKFADSYINNKDDPNKIETCCCYSTSKGINTQKNLISPYDSPGTLVVDKWDLLKTYEGGNGYRSESNASPVKWDYRYSQTKYVYPTNNEQYDQVKTGVAPLTNTFDSTGLNDYGNVLKSYNPQLYFEDRDFSATFGQNHLFDSGEVKSIPMLNPQTQHVSAFQTLCLTGMYNRLKLLRNILNNIKTCIESAKYTGAYSNEVCKELFSRYVCQTVSDLVVSMGSGCSPYSVNNLLGNESDDSIMKQLSVGMSGVSEGVGGTISDFNNDYGNAKMNTLLGGGVSGFAQKACMAALGYEWELNFNSIMDAAYSTSMPSYVIVPTLRRSYLFTNAATQLPVFEYRGAIDITPGCDIDGYTASLVCVSRLDKKKHPEIQCSGTEDCACWNAASPVPPFTGVINGGRLKATVPEDKAFHKVNENSAFVYDHLRVELIFSNLVNQKNCLPDEHQDGVFYFPIADRTPFNLIGCQINPISGGFACTSGLAKELGFGNLKIHEVQMETTAVVGNTFKAFPVLTKSGVEPMCLYWTVFQGDGVARRAIQNTLYVPITETYQNSKYIQGIDVFKDQNVPTNLLGSGATIQNIKLNAPSNSGSSSTITGNTQNTALPGQCNSVTPDLSVPLDSESGVLSVILKDEDKNGLIICDVDSYSLTGLNQNMQKIPKDCIISSGGKKIKISSINLWSQKECATSNPPLNDIKLEITLYNPSTGITNSDYSVVFQAGRPATANSDCKNGLMFPNEVFTRQFTVSRISSGANSNSNNSNSQNSTSDSYITASAPQFESIKILDSSSNFVSQNINLNAFPVDKNNEYSVIITRPSTGMDNIDSFVWKIEDLNGHLVFNSVLTTEPQNTQANYYRLATITTASLNEDNVYTVYVEVHTKDNKILALNKQRIYVKKTTTQTISGTQKCGPTGNLNCVDVSTCGSQDQYSPNTCPSPKVCCT